MKHPIFNLPTLHFKINKLILMKYFRINCSMGSNNLYMTSKVKSDQYVMPNKIKADLFEEGRTFFDKFFNYF